MRILVLALCGVLGAFSQPHSCDLARAEKEVRDVVKQVTDLRARQDQRFLSFYASDEYSFPGESWVFRGGDRTAERTRNVESATRAGETWRIELRDLRLEAGCEIGWAAGFVHVELFDSDNKLNRQAEWRITVVLAHRPSGWQIVHQHSSKPTTDPREWWKPRQSADSGR